MSTDDGFGEDYVGYRNGDNRHDDDTEGPRQPRG
jgi:hypothetical protein